MLRLLKKLHPKIHFKFDQDYTSKCSVCIPIFLKDLIQTISRNVESENHIINNGNIFDVC